MTERCKLRIRIGVLIALFVLALLQQQVALAEEQCEGNGIVFGFFNGVQTDEDDAKLALNRHMAPLYGPTSPKGDPITYELFYNDTGGLADFVEVFDQRLQEHNGFLAGRFELFFSAMKGGGSWWDRITDAIPAAGKVLADLSDGYLAAVAHGLTRDLGKPNTFEVAQRHREQIDLWTGMDRKLLLVAHSQGNLFVNAAYDHALGKTRAESVKVVHIAPASPRVSGAHTLADKDIVINLLRATGSVPGNTQVILPYLHRPPGLNAEKDILGHGLLEIYLNPALPTSGAIRDQIMAALDALQSPEKAPKEPFPDFVSMPWTGGQKPVVVVEPGSASHEFEGREQTHRPGRYWTRVDEARWDLASSLNQRDYDKGVNESWSARVAGHGVEGFAECKTSWRRVRDAHIVGRVECVYDNYFTEASGGVHGWAFQENKSRPLELGQFKDSVSPGGVVQLSQETSYANRGFMRDQQLHFLSGTYVVETTLESKVNDYGREVFYVVRKADVNTVKRRSEAFTASPSTIKNLQQLRQWEVEYDTWRGNEDLRLAQYVRAKAAYDSYREQCSLPTPPPPPPPKDEDCPPESHCEAPKSA